jgi:hypothetical protein
MVGISGDMDNQEQQNSVDLSHGLPALFTVGNLVEAGKTVWIKKDHLCGMKANCGRCGKVPAICCSSVRATHSGHGMPCPYGNRAMVEKLR